MEIKITDIENIKVGSAQDLEAATGVTVVICEKGAPTGITVMGGGPASRDSNLLDPLSSGKFIHGVALAGGSAFGLDAAGGVMQYLEERGIGYDTGAAKVPLVCQSDIYDLGVGKADVRPDKAMAYAACQDAERNDPKEGNVGAGTGATVGKIKGVEYAMKSGLGIYAEKIGDLKVGAVVAVNAFGDVFDYDTKEKLAGYTLGSCEEALYSAFQDEANLFVGNTTIGVVVTNAAFDKAQMTKIARMAHNGYPQVICPINTTADGDSVYAMSVGDVKANIDVVGTLAQRVMAKAINRAVKEAKPAYGLKAYNK
ncbi:MAG: P1 family peptidase [Clostridia bacterium]|nr:P1 family peptidase [Clostridia bacterium]